MDTEANQWKDRGHEQGRPTDRELLLKSEIGFRSVFIRVHLWFKFFF